MNLIDQIYESAANSGLLKECLWYPSNGAPSQRHQVGFAAPDESLLDGLTLSTDYEMTYPVVRASSDIMMSFNYPDRLPTTLIYDRGGRQIGRAHV